MKASITIEIAVQTLENSKLGIERPEYRPLIFDSNYLVYYILYEDTVGFLVLGTPFTCKKTEENICKLKEAMDRKTVNEMIISGVS